MGRMQWKDLGSDYNTTELTQYFQLSLLFCLTLLCNATDYMLPDPFKNLFSMLS
jgi:hypothetical protein